jgi:hypothetical protein
MFAWGGARLQPPENQYPLRVEMTPYLQDYRATLLRHPATKWAANIHRLHSGRSAEVSRLLPPREERPMNWPLVIAIGMSLAGAAIHGIVGDRRRRGGPRSPRH